MKAHDHLALVALPAAPGIIEAAVAHFEGLLGQTPLSEVEAAELRAAAADLARYGNMSADVERAWRGLRSRISDPEIASVIDAVDERVARGACSGGEVSAATVGFSDGSYMILVDHGLATLTWLAAGLVATDADPTTCARAIRLALARPATGNAAGPTPSLALPASAIRRAGSIVAEMDHFLIGHELAHVLLDHVSLGGRPLGVVSGPGVLVGKRPEAEHAADLLALTLLFDDTTVDAIDEADAARRLGAVRLLLQLIERYERQCFAVQPTSHPPAHTRWEHLASIAVDPWFEGQPPSDERMNQIIDAMRDLDNTPGVEEDATAVRDGLGDWLDFALWKHSDWLDLARMNSFLLVPGPQAVRSLLTWPGWSDHDDAAAETERLIGIGTSAEPVRGALRTALTGGAPLTRVDLIGLVDNAVRPHLPTAVNPPFPMWAIAALVADTIAPPYKDEP